MGDVGGERRTTRVDYLRAGTGGHYSPRVRTPTSLSVSLLLLHRETLSGLMHSRPPVSSPRVVIALNCVGPPAYVHAKSCIHGRSSLAISRRHSFSSLRKSMAGLQRSSGTFRRSGSSGMVWDDDRRLSGEIIRPPSPGRRGAGGDDGPPARVQRSRSHGHGGYRASAGRVSPALDPPSPRVGVCGFCAFFRGKHDGGKAKPKIVPRAGANHSPRVRRASG